MGKKYYKLYKFFRKYLELSDKAARDSVQLIGELIKCEQDEQSDRYVTNEGLNKAIDGLRNELLLTIAGLEVKLTKKFYWMSLIQFLAIVASIMGLMHYMQK